MDFNGAKKRWKSTSLSSPKKTPQLKRTIWSPKWRFGSDEFPDFMSGVWISGSKNLSFRVKKSTSPNLTEISRPYEFGLFHLGDGWTELVWFNLQSETPWGGFNKMGFNTLTYSFSHWKTTLNERKTRFGGTPIFHWSMMERRKGMWLWNPLAKIIPGRTFQWLGWPPM